MNGSLHEVEALAGTIAARPIANTTKVAVFPPFTGLYIVAKELTGTPVSLGAQDCSPEKSGAFTGDISADMLKELGCEYVILGHSERRILHGESDELVKRKAIAAMNAGLKPVICVGENLAERESGNYLKIIAGQVGNSLPYLVHSESYLIAYEPVWAIGSSKTPTTEQISEVHKTIASILYRDTQGATDSSAKTPILYGGSVKASNARGIMASEGVDGVLVGGASLKADEFTKIIEGAG